MIKIKVLTPKIFERQKKNYSLVFLTRFKSVVK